MGSAVDRCALKYFLWVTFAGYSLDHTCIFASEVRFNWLQTICLSGTLFTQKTRTTVPTLLRRRDSQGVDCPKQLTCMRHFGKVRARDVPLKPLPIPNMHE